MTSFDYHFNYIREHCRYKDFVVDWENDDYRFTSPDYSQPAYASYYSAVLRRTRYDGIVDMPHYGGQRNFHYRGYEACPDNRYKAIPPPYAKGGRETNYYDDTIPRKFFPEQKQDGSKGDQSSPRNG